MQLSEVYNHSVEEVLQSPQLTMALLRAYSALRLNGNAPRGCSRSIRRYYMELNDFNIAKNDKIMAKTCKFNKLVYIASEGVHYADINMSDEKATEFLDKKILSPDDFLTLPAGWKARKHPDILDVLENAKVVPAPIKRKVIEAVPEPEAAQEQEAVPAPSPKSAK